MRQKAAAATAHGAVVVIHNCLQSSASSQRIRAVLQVWSESG